MQSQPRNSIWICKCITSYQKSWIEFPFLFEQSGSSASPMQVLSAPGSPVPTEKEETPVDARLTQGDFSKFIMMKLLGI